MGIQHRLCCDQLFGWWSSSLHSPCSSSEGISAWTPSKFRTSELVWLFYIFCVWCHVSCM